LCPVCSTEYLPEDLNIRHASIISVKPEQKKKFEDMDNIEDSEDIDADDIISLDDQKDIEDSNEDIKTD
jgi:hypothetical protein